MAMCKQLCRYQTERDGWRKILFSVTASALLNAQLAFGVEAPPQDPPAILESNQCRPAYPRAAFEKRQEGTVKMQFTVGANGKLVGSAVVKSSGFRELDQAALQSLIHCRFKPAYRDGKPVQAAFFMEYRWQLQELLQQ
jgi:TonB family protein